ncbi:MAG: enoyl-CoA hydratase/isomerase family protein [Rhodobiaceae bacterium]|nr:enoyl-CoA hydratase/isomerase family protein [Rhodobiaceae bacterium]
MAQESDVLQVEKLSEWVTLLWLNRPHKKNSVSKELLERLDETITGLEKDDSVRVIVFRGRGGTFCAGADLEGSVGPTLAEIPMAYQQAMSGFYTRLYNLKKPTVAVVEGYATAGGFELMLACDFAIAASDARIGDYHINRGLFAGAGPLYRLPRVVGIRRTKELMMTGKLLSGDECADWGLVNNAVPTSELDREVRELCEMLASKSPFAMAMTKAAVNRGLDADTESLVMLEMMTVNLVNQSEDAKEGVNAFVEKRPPNWKGR